LSFYDGLDTIDVAPLVRVRKELETKNKQLDQTSGFLNRLGSLKLSLTSLDEALKPELPDGEALENKGRRLVQVSGFLEDLTEKLPVLRTLMTLDQMALPEAPLAETHAKLVRTDSLSRRLQLLEAAQAELSPVEQIALPEESPLRPKLVDLEKAAHWWRRWSAAEAELAKVPEIAELPEIDTLQHKLQEYTRYYRMLDDAKTLAEAIRNAQDQIKLAEAEEAKTLADLEALGMCPTCDQPVGSNHRLHMEVA
jgi:hypothetical protein